MAVRRASVVFLVLYALLIALTIAVYSAGLKIPMYLTPLITLVGFIFGLLHASQREGWTNTLRLLALVFGVSLLFESVGVATGWIYGPYHYTDKLGPLFLGLVPYLIPVAWFSFLVGHVHFLLARPGVYVGTLFYLLTRPHPSLRDRLMTVLHFLEGVYAAHLLRGQEVDHLHAHFADRAATVTLVASRMLRIPYSLAIHAGGDIYVHPVLLPAKVAEARFIISCTRYNVDYLKQQGIPGLDKALVIHHGLDFEHYPAAIQQPTPILLAVGQLVEKKGFEYLIRACQQLRDEGREFVCRLIGPGPEGPRLQALVDQLDLHDRVTLCGAMPHDDVIAEYGQATVFVLPCIRGKDGDLDGIPNVLLEAMAARVPVVSTPVSAIPELVQDEVNGLLVPPNDHQALAVTLARLLDDAPLRKHLGDEGWRTVVEHFDLERNVRAVYDVFTRQAG